MLVVLSGSEMTSTSFPMAESFFKSWNKTSCALSIPQMMAQSCSTEELAAKITAALDPTTVRTVQATAKRRFLLEFSSVPAASAVMTAGVDIEGIHLTPMVAFDKLTSVFVSRIPPRVTDDQFVKAFSPFGRVVSVKPLPLRLQPNVFSGTRLLRMAVSKPIPSFFQVMGFPGLVRYRGQPFQCFRCRELGHCYRECPSKPLPSASRKRKARSSSLSSSSSCPLSPPPLVITECRPDGVAAIPSQQPLGGSVVSDPPAMEVEAVVVDGPTIVSPTLPSSSGPVVEVIAVGDVPRLAGARPSAPVLADVGCQTDVGLCPSVATPASIVPPPRWMAAAESQTPPPPACQDGGIGVQGQLGCCVRYNAKRFENGRMMVSLCREDLLNALLSARACGMRSNCSVVGWQPVLSTGLSQGWPEQQFGYKFAVGHDLDSFDIQLALPC